jgi:hypothetical protein
VRAIIGQTLGVDQNVVSLLSAQLFQGISHTETPKRA